jgi:organic radical activating enzyme
MIYQTFDFIVTLRCNGGCKNCIRFCGMSDVTGLKYNDTDITLVQVNKFISQVKALYKDEPVIGEIILTGGEPMMHKDIKEIFFKLKKELVDTKIVNNLLINSNLVLEIEEELKPFIINFSTPDKNPEIHNVVLFHPDDMKKPRPTFDKCNHYRKNRPVLSVYGYNMCCAAQGYIALFGLDNLFIDELPDDPSKFPVKEMDDVCQHCPFPHMTENTYLEKAIGRPVSKIYKVEAELNREGRFIKKRF